MPAPFYSAIKGTTSGAPGTGAFTPNAAATNFEPWSGVPVWIGMVRYEDGSAWERQYSYWNGTTLSRSSTQFIASSTGSALSLTLSATAAMIVDPGEVMSHIGTTQWRILMIPPNSTTMSSLGAGPGTATGTAAAVAIAATNFLTSQAREQLTSVTTINGQAGWSFTTTMGLYSTTAGLGGAEFISRWGATTLPTAPRLFAGMTSVTFVASTAEPSTLVANVAAFAKDSTDTNIQLLVNNNSGNGTKTDTGIPLVANGWYESSIWWEPGGGNIYGLLIRIDTGDIWFGKTSTDIPVTGALMFPQVLGGLNGTNTGTAFVMHMGSIAVRNGT